MRAFERPWRPFVWPDGTQADGPVLDVLFPGIGEVQPMFLDTGATVSVATRDLADAAGLGWEKGKRMTMKGLSAKPACAVPGRILDTELFVLPAGWRLTVPIFFTEESVPTLAGRQGFLDRLHVTLNGNRRTMRVALP